MSNLNVINASVSTVEVIAQEPKGMVQSRLVFQVSRFKSTRKGDQVRLHEYCKGDITDIKAMATLHLKHSFLSGMPDAFVTPEGLFWSMDRESKNQEQFFGFQLNFSKAQMLAFEKQLTDELKKTWSEDVPKKDSGASDLRGYQLHVTLKPGAMMRIQLENNDAVSQKENLILDPSEIEGIEIVEIGSEHYAHRGHQVSFNAFVGTVFKPATANIATSPEEVEALRERLHSNADKGIGVKNRYRRGNKAAEAGAAETKVTTTEEMG